ncbi:MAG: BlaI/MecI/CopY family transcriptional regulator [Bacteroidota bacterium]
MKNLSPKELQLMHLLWRMEKAFVKELVEQFPDPKPHYNTISTTIRVLEEKGYVSHESFGQAHRYFPLIRKEEYQSTAIGDVLKTYFDNSYPKMVAYFAKEEKISPEELKDILRMIANKES